MMQNTKINLFQFFQSATLVNMYWMHWCLSTYFRKKTKSVLASGEYVYNTAMNNWNALGSSFERTEVKNNMSYTQMSYVPLTCKAFVNPLGGSKGLSISVSNFGCWKDKFNMSA